MNHLKNLLVMICVFGLSLAVSYEASAQFAESPCDPDYYRSLESRAWLEAQREVTQNQNLIFKPDSVLEYTCFDRQLSELAQHARDMFSETTRWGQVLGPNQSRSMDNALEALVGRAYSNYDQSNFNHDLLGGRGLGSSSVPDEYTPSASVNGGDYTCNIMQAVWQRAKCMDFIDSEGTDGFFTFANYASTGDKRSRPSLCGGIPDEWQQNIARAGGGDGEGGRLWDADDVNTYLNKLFPPSGCGSGASSFVRTGLTVRSAELGQFNEHVCAVPGCAWDPESNTCVE